MKDTKTTFLTTGKVFKKENILYVNNNLASALSEICHPSNLFR